MTGAEKERITTTTTETMEAAQPKGNNGPATNPHVEAKIVANAHAQVAAAVRGDTKYNVL